MNRAATANRAHLLLFLLLLLLLLLQTVEDVINDGISQTWERPPLRLWRWWLDDEDPPDPVATVWPTGTIFGLTGQALLTHTKQEKKEKGMSWAELRKKLVYGLLSGLDSTGQTHCELVFPFFLFQESQGGKEKMELPTTTTTECAVRRSGTWMNEWCELVFLSTAKLMLVQVSASMQQYSTYSIYSCCTRSSNHFLLWQNSPTKPCQRSFSCARNWQKERKKERKETLVWPATTKERPQPHNNLCVFWQLPDCSCCTTTVLASWLSVPCRKRERELAKRRAAKRRGDRKKRFPSIPLFNVTVLLFSIARAVRGSFFLSAKSLTVGQRSKRLRLVVFKSFFFSLRRRRRRVSKLLIIEYSSFDNVTSKDVVADTIVLALSFSSYFWQ